MSPSTPIILPAFALVLLTFVVGMRMLYLRVREMRIKRVHPQAAATSLQMAAKLEDVRASDNFRNLFETPVLFYALVGVAVGSGFTPGWLVAGAWVYVMLRAAHSAIHCTTNRVMHRFPVYFASSTVLFVLWLLFAWRLMLAR